MLLLLLSSLLFHQLLLHELLLEARPTHLVESSLPTGETLAAVEGGGGTQGDGR